MTRLLTIAASVLAALALACGGDEGSSPAATTSPAPGQATQPASGGSSATTIDVVAAAGNVFEPRRPTVRAGQPFTVNVRNSDSVAHNFTIQNGPSSGNIAPGATATVSFTAPTGGGGIAFFCSIHGQSSMNGTIVYQ
jgi:nitrite reductase (NO-forming)